MSDDRWLKVCITIIVAVLVWAVIMMTISTFHSMHVADQIVQSTEAKHER